MKKVLILTVVIMAVVLFSVSVSAAATDYSAPGNHQLTLNAAVTGGDINGDDVMDANDVVAVKAALLDGSADLDYMDFNFDGIVGVTDLVIMKRIFVGIR